MPGGNGALKRASPYARRMQISIDGQVVPFDGQPDNPTLQQVFDGLQFLMTQGQVHEAGPDGVVEERLIVRVVVDGQPVLPADLELMMGKDVSDSELEFETMAQRDVMGVVLQDAAAKLREVAVAQREAAESFQADEAPAAFEKLSAAITGWIEVSSAVTQSAALANVELDTLTVEAEGEVVTASALAQELAAQLGEVKSTLETRDISALADVVGYEWAPLSEKWIGIVEQLGDRIAAQ